MRNFRKVLGADQRGFTLIELLVALVIFSIMLGLAALNQSTFVSAFKLKSGTRQVMSDMQLVRAKAISQNARFQVIFNTGSPDQYVVQRFDGAAWQDYRLYVRGDGTAGTTQPITLPDGVACTNTTTVEFRPRGSAVTSSGPVQLTYEGSAPMTLTVGLNGLVTSS